jgi:hypothetical protein
MQSFPEKKRIFRAFRLAFPEQWAILAGERDSARIAPPFFSQQQIFVNKPKQERNPEP